MENKKSEISLHQTHVDMVLTPPDEVYAGLEVKMQVKVSCPEKCEVQEGRVSILDMEGSVVTDIDLAALTEEDNGTVEFTVKMPIETGLYTWTAQFIPVEIGEVLHEVSSVPFTFSVIPHSISVSVWGAPLPAIKGDEFTVKVGAKSVSYTHLTLPTTPYV